MKCLISYTRNKPTTSSGFSLVVTQTYTSFDEKEINALEEKLKESCGSTLVVDFNTEGRGVKLDR